MTSNRIQKLLFSEYSDFEDIVLVEGPFAETDRHGKGIRQVQIGLTPTKLILASYFVEPVAVEELGDQWQPRRGLDPDVESFELISAYPVECVNLSVYRRRRRQTVKARFCNGKVAYYEIGGWQERKMLWSVWCERIKFLSPYESRTSISETSVGSSTSGNSSLYIVRSSLSVNQTGKPTLWCHYACAEGGFQSSWPDPHLYLGPKFYEKGVNSASLPGGEIAKHSGRSNKTQPLTKKICRRQMKEPLFLSTDMEVMAAEAVELWERRSLGTRPRVRRRYAFTPSPYVLGGLGPWRLSKSVAFSVQTKKNASSVDLREVPEELRGPLPKGRLVRTVSLECLEVPVLAEGSLLRRQSSRQRDLMFWARFPDELLQWGKGQYKTQQRYLRASKKRTEPRSFGMKERKKLGRKQSRSKTENAQNLSIRPESDKSMNSCGAGAGGDSLPPCHIYGSVKDEGEEGWLLPVSRFTSANLAHQLTTIHKQLFLQVTTLDLARARSDMDSWRSPGFRILVFFSHRISCIVANHILLENEVQKRALVISKLMSVAHKCHRMQSLMSAEAVLRGLHSPPVYRLHRTWAYVRRHHAANYRRFEDLSRRYYDCRAPLFQKTYDDVVQVPPFLPTIALITAVLLGSLQELPQVQSFKFASAVCSERHRRLQTPAHTSSSAGSVTAPSSVRKFLSALQLSPSLPPPSPPPHSPCRSRSHLHSASRETLLERLDTFFAPVSDAPTPRLLQDLQYFLESHQAAASRYQIPINPRVRAFLLHSRHPDMQALFRQSLLIEP